MLWFCRMLLWCFILFLRRKKKRFLYVGILVKPKAAIDFKSKVQGLNLNSNLKPGYSKVSIAHWHFHHAPIGKPTGTLLILAFEAAKIAKPAAKAVNKADTEELEHTD